MFDSFWSLYVLQIWQLLHALYIIQQWAFGFFHFCIKEISVSLSTSSNFHSLVMYYWYLWPHLHKLNPISFLVIISTIYSICPLNSGYASSIHSISTLSFLIIYIQCSTIYVGIISAICYNNISALLITFHLPFRILKASSTHMRVEFWIKLRLLCNIWAKSTPALDVLNLQSTYKVGIYL